MSERAVSVDPHGGIDARARRTRLLLAEALLSLDADADLDAMGVGAIVEHAGISRSTFYQHFASKDDFLVRSFVNLIDATDKAYARHYPDHRELIPSWPLLRHVSEAEDFVRVIVRSEVYSRQMAAGEERLRAIAEGNMARLTPHWSGERRRETAIYVAGGFIGLLRWWMESGLKKPAADVQAAFARLSESALQAN